MDYSKIYKDLISKARKSKRIKSDDNYYEDHHIIPRCLGGGNDVDNMVLFTAREHYVAHRLLTKIHPESFDLKLAVLLMAAVSNSRQLISISSRDYATLRNDVSLVRINKAKQENTLELIPNLKVTIPIRNRMRRGSLFKKETKVMVTVLNKFIGNLILANYCNCDLTFPRNTGTKVGKLSVYLLLKAEKLLLKHGFIKEVVVDSESPLSARKRCRIIPSERILEFEDAIVELLKINEEIIVDRNDVGLLISAMGDSFREEFDVEYSVQLKMSFKDGGVYEEHSIVG